MISFLHLRATGVQLEVENPKLEDYRNAERRACLHLSPQPPETKSDEMRDLVIWEVALRVAKRDGKAILVSRDHVHSDERGDKSQKNEELSLPPRPSSFIEKPGHHFSRPVVSASTLPPIIWHWQENLECPGSDCCRRALISLVLRFRLCRSVPNEFSRQ
jgi:hypothetical protein